MPTRKESYDLLVPQKNGTMKKSNLFIYPFIFLFIYLFTCKQYVRKDVYNSLCTLHHCHSVPMETCSYQVLLTM